MNEFSHRAPELSETISGADFNNLEALKGTHSDWGGAAGIFETSPSINAGSGSVDAVDNFLATKLLHLCPKLFVLQITKTTKKKVYRNWMSSTTAAGKS